MTRASSAPAPLLALAVILLNGCSPSPEVGRRISAGVDRKVWPGSASGDLFVIREKKAAAIWDQPAGQGFALGEFLRPTSDPLPHAFQPGERRVLFLKEQGETHKADLFLRSLAAPEAVLIAGSMHRHAGFSPDGKYLAYVDRFFFTATPWARGRLMLYEVDTATLSVVDDQVWTNFAGYRSALPVVFSPAGTHLLYQVARSELYSFEARLWSLATQTTEVISTGVGLAQASVSFSSDGSLIAIVEAVEAYPDWTDSISSHDFRLIVYTVSDGSRIVVHTDVPRWGGVHWDPDGKGLWYSPNGPYRMVRYAVDTRQSTTFSESASVVAYAPDGSSVVVSRLVARPAEDDPDRVIPGFQLQSLTDKQTVVVGTDDADVRYSSKGQWLVVEQDGTTSLWSTATFTEEHAVTAERGLQVSTSGVWAAYINRAKSSVESLFLLNLESGSKHLINHNVRSTNGSFLLADRFVAYVVSDRGLEGPNNRSGAYVFSFDAL